MEGGAVVVVVLVCVLVCVLVLMGIRAGSEQALTAAVEVGAAPAS